MVLIAALLGLLAGLAAKAGMKPIAKFFGVIAFLLFMTWLFSGNGAAILDWFDNPSVPMPNVEMPQ